jgi:hypothetical protein
MREPPGWGWHLPDTASAAARRLAWVGERQLEVRPGPGGAPRRSPLFGADVRVACLSGSMGRVMTTDRNFATEIWRGDFGARLGPPLLERRLFSNGETPDIPESVLLSADEDVAVTHSWFWDSPNVGHTWVTAWDVETGIPLIERTHLVHEGGVSSLPDRAAFDASGRYLALVYGADSALHVADVLELRPPGDVLSWLPDLAEAMGGVALDTRGNPVPVPGRVERLQRHLPVLDRYRRGSASGWTSVPPH